MKDAEELCGQIAEEAAMLAEEIHCLIRSKLAWRH